ncbi:MAG: hypothetical protein H0U67_01110 [Gemmatimonadetes bacterium]|nr:hypothetical protein [Gemmatimonadota bacterium]
MHRLLRPRHRVQRDWLPLVAALMVMMLILDFWWIFFGLGKTVAWTGYSAFLVLAASLVCMFLLASATLPDQVSGGRHRPEPILPGERAVFLEPFRSVRAAHDRGGTRRRVGPVRAGGTSIEYGRPSAA